MDPEATLKEIREYYGEPLSSKQAHRLADLIEVLDVWLSNGGFLPSDWKKEQAG
jgi:hypothetical protein